MPEDQNTGLIDDDAPDLYPDIVENEDGTVTIAGQEAEPEKPEEPATEEPSEEAPPEEEPQVDPFTQAFLDAGLDKQFPGGVEEMIRRVPDWNKHITTLQQQNADFRRQQDKPVEQPKVEQPSAEEFYNNPAEAIGKIMDAKTQELTSRIDEKLTLVELTTFANNHKDYQAMEPHMVRELEANPELKALGMKAIPILYKMAKAANPPVVIKKETPAPDKSRAISDSGGKKTTKTGRSLQDWAKMTTREIEKEIGIEE